ncbi:hypothetical protein HMPREF3166_05970 [Corynebacterium sp. HMSC08A12]|uniref:hypothetical protein n=1 Tax=Corynebacterium sp. HMSC08A12 TaxID=1581134 RepID=UPI0008A479F3|nr:hypothetical protein [Corynebacterium sp. HMSC08A12]OFT34221.1 hypothetical protein HMPREF3166_05970 [Corynebacterium sp. HMSC08A12]
MGFGVFEDPARDIYEEFLSRYEQQYYAAGLDDAFDADLGGECEYALMDAVLFNDGTEVVIADDMLDKILSLYSPESYFGKVLREDLKKYRPDYVERPVQ